MDFPLVCFHTDRSGSMTQYLIRRCSRNGSFAVQREYKQMRGAWRRCGTLRVASVSCAPARSATTTCTWGECASAFGTGGNADVLLAIDHEGNGWPHLRSVQIQFEQFLTSIGAERQQPIVHAGEHQVASCGEASACERSSACAGGAPALFARDRIPRVENVTSRTVGSNLRKRLWLGSGSRRLLRGLNCRGFGIVRGRRARRSRTLSLIRAPAAG